MATYTNDLRLKEIATGDEDGTWGTSTNTNLSLIADAFRLGTKQMAANANETFTMPDGTADGVRAFYLKLTSAVSLSATRTVTLAPNTVSKVWIIENATTGSQIITIKQGSGATVNVPNGSKLMVVTDGAGSGAAVFNADSTVSLATGVTGTLPIANGGTGTTSTTFANLTTNVTGTLPVGNGGTGATTLTANNVILGNGGSAVQFVAPGTNGNVLTSNGTTWQSTAPVAGVTLSGNNAFTGANTFYNATGQTFGTATSTQDGIILAGRAGGSSSYRVTMTPTTLTASRTLTLPDATDTISVLGTAQTFTAAQTFRAANAIRSEAASTQDAVVVAGRAGGTSSYAITLTPATLSASRTLTLPDPGSNETLGYLNIPQVSQSAAYTLVLTDAGKQIFHPSADTTARTFTIPANGSVVFPVGTAVTFINQNGAGVITIAITTDTMRLAGAGTTGSRTLAANGVATAVKVTSTEWIISGVGLT
jgi:hypothetical protein